MKVDTREATGADLSQHDSMFDASDAGGQRASKRLALGEGPLANLRALSNPATRGLVMPMPPAGLGLSNPVMLQNLQRVSEFAKHLSASNLSSLAASQQQDGAAQPPRRKKRSLGSKIRGAFKKLGGGIKNMFKTGLSIAKGLIKQPFDALKRGVSALLKGDLKGVFTEGLNLAIGRLRMPMQALKQLMNRQQ